MATTDEIKAVKSAADIIEGLRDLEQAGVTKLADHLGIAKSTAHKHLNTLHELEYVKKTDAGEYKLSLKALEIGGFGRARMKLFKQSKQQIRELAQQTSETAILTVEEFNRNVVLLQRASNESVPSDLYPGCRLPLHSCATGKAILAYKSREEVEAIIDDTGLSQRTENTITDRTTLFEELAEIRERRYALNLEERIRGTRSIATPIIPVDEPIGAISVYGPASRMTTDRLESELPEVVKKYANIIEVSYNHS